MISDDLFSLSRKIFTLKFFNDILKDISKMNNELNDVRRKIEERDTVNSQLVRNKNSLSQTNDELKRQVDEESKSKNALAHTLQVRQKDLAKTVKLHRSKESYFHNYFV